MESWSTHHIYEKARKKFDEKESADIQKYAANLVNKKLPVIFSLGHLSKIVGLEYNFLHETVSRKREVANYNLFSISKRSGGKRWIHSVKGRLFYLQKFINEEILQKVQSHPSSFAFHSSGGIRNCAQIHCGAKWIFQFDLKDFFYSISEYQVYKAFCLLGYKKLLSFEMARICTTIHLSEEATIKYIRRSLSGCFDLQKSEMPYKKCVKIGVLPQGAPTSPMLSNLVSIKLDELLYDYCRKNNFIYSRYADDLTFSASALPANKSIGKIQKEVIQIIRKGGFMENREKMRVAGPGSKKIVLGLLVDGEHPRISKDTYKRIDRHLYASEKYGIAEVATHEKFDSVYGFYNHLKGLLSYVKDVDFKKWEIFNEKWRRIEDDFFEIFGDIG